MNDHHLDDLIIGDPQPGSGNSKGLLTIIALLIVILIVGLILWALLFGSSDDAATSPAQNTSQTQTLDPNLIPLDKNGNEQPAAKPKPVKKPTPVLEQKPAPKPVKKPAVKPTPAPKPAPAAQPKPQKPKVAPTPSTPKAQTPPKPAETTTPQKPGSVLIKNADKTIYYIQVGAFKRDPSPKFMKKLKDNGFTFITKKTNNMRRVRVGPYDSYDQAKAALPKIKAKLGIDGLIVKF